MYADSMPPLVRNVEGVMHVIIALVGFVWLASASFRRQVLRCLRSDRHWMWFMAWAVVVGSCQNATRWALGRQHGRDLGDVLMSVGLATLLVSCLVIWLGLTRRRAAERRRRAMLPARELLRVD
jgi:hypothetical protein